MSQPPSPVHTQYLLSPNGDTLLHRRGTDTIRLSLTLSLGFGILLKLIDACLTVQEAALLDRTSTLHAARATHLDVSIATSTLRCIAHDGRGEMRDVLGKRVLGTDAARIDGGGFAGFGKCVVAAVEVLAFFQVFS